MNAAIRPWYAANARQLLEARKQGFMPTGPVIVSLVGGEWDVTTLYVHSDMPIAKLDWRMLVNLEVWLWATPAVALDRVTEVALQIAKVRPKTIFVRMEVGAVIHDVQIGDGFHLGKFVPEVPAIHEFSVSISNNTGSPFGAALRRALMTKFNGVQTL